MRHAICLAIVTSFAVFFSAREVSASVFTAIWTGQIDTVVDPDGDFGGQVNVGGGFSLSYNFDTATIADILPGDPTIGLYDFFGDPKLTLDSIDLTTNAELVRLDVRDNWNGLVDRYALNNLAGFSEQGLTDVLFSVVLDDPSLTNGLAGDAMVQPGINVGDFDQASFQVIEEGGLPDESRVEGTILTLTFVLVGDFDGDGDVDLADFSNFSLCFAGSGVPPAVSCPAGVDADFDADGDVDLTDLSTFSTNITGPV